MVRKILHLDLDAFFCAVEEQNDPSLSGKPFAVGGRPDQRGVIASCSYAARRFGVRSAMPTGRALRLCPELRLVHPRHRQYSQVSAQVMQRLHALTSQVEQISIDEAFLDVTDLQESAEAIARQLQETIHRELNLPCSLGVATNKLVAKIANDVGKANAGGLGPPNAITVVHPGEEAAFLAPLPVVSLWGVGPKTAQRMQAAGIHTIGDLAQAPVTDLVREFGKNGPYFSSHARGLDESPIITFHEPKSFSRETTFAQDTSSREQLLRTLQDLSQSVSRHMKKAGHSGNTIKLKLRWSDFTTLTRQSTLAQPTNDPEQILNTARTLFDATWVSGKPVRLIGVGVSGLGTASRQLGLFDPPAPEESEKQRQLQSAIQQLRQRYGDNILQRGKHKERQE